MELKLSTGIYAGAGETPTDCFIFSFTNAAPAWGLLQSYGLAFKKPDSGAQDFQPAQDPSLPRKFAPGERAKVGMDQRLAAKALVALGLKGKVEVEGFHGDASGMHFTGVSLVLDLDKWGS
ncbi:MAG: hypothetical protein AAB152_07200 [Candidatus Coatesbacteria bacterium]